MPSFFIHAKVNTERMRRLYRILCPMTLRFLLLPLPPLSRTPLRLLEQSRNHRLTTLRSRSVLTTYKKRAHLFGVILAVSRRVANRLRHAHRLVYPLLIQAQ